MGVLTPFCLHTTRGLCPWSLPGYSELDKVQHSSSTTNMGNTVATTTEKIKVAQGGAETKSQSHAAEMRRDLAALSVILDAKEAEFRRQLIVQNTANKQLPIVELVRLVSEKA